MKILLAAILSLLSLSNGFHVTTTAPTRGRSVHPSTSGRANKDRLWQQANDADTDESSSSEQSDLEAFLKEEYSAFHALLSLNEEVWKTLEKSESESGCTIFAPTNEAFDSLGDKKLAQLKDARNLETAQKMGLYHVIGDEAVEAARLRTEDWTTPAPKDGSPRPTTVQAIVTMAGEVPVGRSKSGGGFLNLFPQEDGDIVIGPSAKIQKSIKYGNFIIHEMNALISPEILWRYCDQLRIPGF